MGAALYFHEKAQRPLDPSQDRTTPPGRPDDPDRRRQLAELTELVGGLAHELRNPLSTMMVNIKLAMEDLDDRRSDPEDARRRALLKLHVVRREAERLQTLFNEFLNLTIADGPRLEATDVNAVVRGLVEFFEPSARNEGVAVELHLAPGALMCQADERMLRQALLNIVINGQQAMPGGGTLRIVTDRQENDAIIRIADTGPGIPREVRDRILRPFFSTKAGGNGLGLSITQRIVNEHGGILTFESEPGEGATFTIRLPRIDEGCAPG